jgi:hypothetical protein
VKVLCSLPHAVRIGFWLAALEFALGLVVGYKAEATTACSDAIVDHLSAVRSLSRVCYAERRCPMHTHSVLIVMVQLLATLLG